MAIHNEVIEHICQSIAQQVNKFDKTIHLNFLIHHAAHRVEAFSNASLDLLSHPAGETAIRLLDSPHEQDHSSFLGLAVWHDKFLGGLSRRTNTLALITLNIDDLETEHAVTTTAWHLTWHALQLAATVDVAESGGVIRPKKSMHNHPSARLRADIFGAAMAYFNGDKDAIIALARERSAATLRRNTGYNPDEYPFPLSIETTHYACKDAMRHREKIRSPIDAALKIANNVGRTYDADITPQWAEFCTPAQHMAWRGEIPEKILSAAVNTSPNTLVRATGFLISELTGIKPASVLAIQNTHSAFAEHKHNQRQHDRLVDKALSDAIEIGLESGNSKIFRDAATRQNEGLVDGHISGWCAAALQAAGEAFQSALNDGSKTPDLAARREFEERRGQTTWESLNQIGQSILHHYQQGHMVTFSDILDFCNDKPEFSALSASIACTIQDPAYLRKLDAANDLNNHPTPQSPALGLAAAPAPTPQSPGPANPMPAAMPSLTLGGGGVQRPPKGDDKEDDIDFVFETEDDTP